MMKNKPILKNSLLITAILFTILFLGSNCSSNDSPPQKEYVKALVNGQPFKSDFMHVTFTNSFEPPYKTLDILATQDANQESIRISIPGYLPEQNYYEVKEIIDENNTNYADFVWQNFEEVLYCTCYPLSGNQAVGEGEIHIIKDTETYVKGTFSFHAATNQNTSFIYVTEGEFFVYK